MFKFKKIISLCLTFIMLFSLSTSAFAAGSTNDSLKKMPPIDVQELNDYGLDGELLIKVLEVAPHIVFSDDGTTLATDLSDDTLLDEFNFTDKQLVNFKAILDGTYQPPSAQNSSIPRIPLDTYQSQGQDESPIVSKAAARFYLSNYDLTSGVFAILGTAASVGPAALMAAWTGVSTALAGPLGTVAGFSTAILGGVFFADLALKITGALVEGKGVAFYLDWGIPPVSTVIE